MKKSYFKRLVDNLFRTKQGFTKVVDAPGGTKFKRACDQTDKRRGADGTMR